MGLMLIAALAGLATVGESSGVHRGSVYQTNSTVGTPTVTSGTDVNAYVWGKLFGGKLEPNTVSRLKWEAGAADIASSKSLIKSRDLGYHSVNGGCTSKDSIKVIISGSINDLGLAKCTNTISANLRYDIGGGRRHLIAGQMVGHDIKGGTNVFSYNLNWGEAPGAVTVGTKNVTWRKAAGGASTTVALTTEGAGAAATMQVSGEEGDVSTTGKSETVIPVPGQAPVIQPPKSVVVEDTHLAPCIHTHQWEFSSDAELTLGVEPVDAATLAVTKVVKYTIDNDAAGSWIKYVGVRLPTDPVPDVPDPAWTTGPSGGPVTLAMAPAIPQSGNHAAILASLAGVAVRGRMPIGLSGENGMRDGLLMVETDALCSEDLEFELVSNPSDLTDLPATITIPAGSFSAARAFEALVASSSCTITATLLDESGSPVSPSVELELAASTQSVASITEPQIESSIRPVEGGMVLQDGVTAGPAGEDLGTLIVHRTGFDSWATSSTVVGISVDDPDGVLVALPSTLTVSAGEDSEGTLISFTSSAGDAVITLSFGSQTVDIPVRSAGPAWSSPIEAVNLPANGTTYIPVEVALPHRNPWSISSSSGNTSVFDVLHGSLDQHPVSRVAFIGVAGASAGNSAVTISTSSLPPIVIPLYVRAEEVTVSGGTVTLSELNGTNPGSILLVAPPGTTFTSATPQGGSSSYLTVSGSSTGVLTATFADGVTRPSQVTISITLSGPGASAPFEMEIMDTLHDQPMNYLITATP